MVSTPKDNDSQPLNGKIQKSGEISKVSLDIISEKFGENKKLKKLTNVRNYMELWRY